MLDEARAAFSARRWDDTIAAYERAGSYRTIPLEDAEKLTWASVLNFPPPSECLAAFERLENAALDAGDFAVAARAAMEAGRVHAMIENGAAAGVAFGRASEHASKTPSGEELLLDAYPAIGAAYAGDATAAAAIMAELLPRAVEAGDTTVEALATLWVAAGKIDAGELDDAVAGLEKAMSMATTGQVHPFYAGMVACGVVSYCRYMGDWDRAKQWNEAADRLCERESICHFPGHCAVFRSEIQRLEGDVEGAATSAREALELAGDWSTAWTGLAHHQIGEAELCLGNLSAAQSAFAQAVEAGQSPQPGRARLLAASGDYAAAIDSLRHALSDPNGPGTADRILVLSAGVSLAIGADEIHQAMSWSAELDGLAESVPTAGARAATDQAAGEIALAAGRPEDAAALLTSAMESWKAAGSSLDAARAREHLALALAAAGHEADAAMHREIATNAYRRTGAKLDLDRMATRENLRTVVRQTLSFTDIVGSSELVAAMGDEAWANVLAAHDRTLRDALAEFGGREIKHEGDGLFVAFTSEDQAVDWAISVQQRLAQHREQHGFAPHVRVGVHCGNAMEYGNDLIGRCVHETARIANAADGDEILVSAGTAAALDSRFTVMDERSVPLKGFDTPFRVVEISWR